MQIAEKELARKEEIGRTLDYLSQQLEQLEILNNLPDDLDQRKSIVNKAMDVRSPSLLYLAVHIRHDTTSLGIIGMIY